jgi:hypothetical protein
LSLAYASVRNFLLEVLKKVVTIGFPIYKMHLFAVKLAVLFSLSELLVILEFS